MGIEGVCIAGRSVSDDLILAIGRMTADELHAGFGDDLVGHYATHCNQQLDFAENDAVILARLQSLSDDEIAGFVASAEDDGFDGGNLSVLIDVINHAFTDTPIAIVGEGDASSQVPACVALLERWCSKGCHEPRLTLTRGM